MKKVVYIVLFCMALFAMSIVEIQASTGTVNPDTGDITSILALTLAGVAAIGGLLLRKAK